MSKSLSISKNTIITAIILCGNLLAQKPIPGLFRTGIDNDGVAQTPGSLELHYATENAQTPQVVARHSLWVQPPAGSAWISLPGGSQSLPIGTYTYKLTFDLSGFDPHTAKISGQVASDNNLTILINGINAGFPNIPGPFTTLYPFAIDTGFVAGMNVLEFQVLNFAVGPSGLLVAEINGEACENANCDTTRNGLAGEYYDGYFNDDFNFFQQNQPLYNRTDATINFDTNSSWNLQDQLGLADLETFSVRWRGRICIPETGTYTFYLRSDDASYLFLDEAVANPSSGNATVNNGGLHVPREVSNSVSLPAGFHDTLIIYGEQSVQNVMQLSWASTDAGIAKQIIPASFLFLPASITNDVSIKNGSFESASVNPGSFVTLPNGSTAIDGWQVTSGNIDYVGSYWIASDSSRSLDLNGTISGSISQTFKTTKGAAYHLQFDMAGNTDCGAVTMRLRLSAAGTSREFDFSTAGNNRQNMGWQKKSFEFVASDTLTTMTFTSLSSGICGPAIDNIRISKPGEDLVSPAVPQQLRVTAGENQVTLAWNPNTEPDLLRYRVYRSTNYPSFTLHNSVPVNATTYVDTGLDPNVIYFYRITAQDSALNESGFSNEVSSYVPKLADLEVTRVQAPPNAFSGQPIQVNWVVANNGNDGTKVPVWYDDIFLSPTSTFDPQTAIHWGRFENFSALSAGEGYANSATFTLPRGIFGDYYIFVRTDNANHERESDESNNQRASDPMSVELSPFPDLQVAAVTAPVNAFSGDSVQVSWTVQNTQTGRTEAEQWFDTIFLSDDDTLDFDFIGGSAIRINEHVLGVFRHQDALEPGASYTAAAKIKLPHAIKDKHTIFVYTDINGGQTQSERGLVYEYDFELNNWDSTAITITLSPVPDLEVAEASAPPLANLGENVEVQWRVINHGPGEPFENNWQDRAYLSRTAAFNPDSAFVLDAFTRTGSLPLESSYTANRTVRIPGGFAGVNYIFVHTDWNNGVFEFQADGNNVSSPVPIVINNPDFETGSVTIPGAANSGENFEVTWNVRNNGPGTVFSLAWNDRVYLSRLPVFNTDSVTVLGSFTRSGAFHKDSSYTVTRSFTLPNGVSGDYYVFVETDADRHVFENLNDNNNRNHSNTAMRVQLSPWADLRVHSIDVPDSLNVGARLAVTWTVENRGVAAATGTWTDRAYLSPGSTWNPNNATLLASAERTRGLEAGASYTQTRNVTLPTSLAGTYVVTVQTDADNNLYEHTDEGNNLTHSDPLNVAAYPPSDLAVSGLLAPDSALSGSAITVQWTVTNRGPATTLAQSWSDHVYLSTDTQLDPNRDLLMAGVARSSALRPNESYTRQAHLTLANGFFGDYYLIVVNDAGAVVNDADRNNNVIVDATRMHIALSPSPDLTITELLLPAQVSAGQPLVLNYTIANRGNGGLSNRNWYDAIYLSQNTTLDNADVALAALLRNLTLSPNSSYSDSVEVEMPGYASGTYFLIMKTDSRNEIYEHDAELNNVRIGSTTSGGDTTGVAPIDIKQPAPADLIVSDITIPANAIPGEETTISWTLKNIGEHRATGRLRDAVYISSDTLFQVEDPVFGVLTHYIDLPPDSSLQINMKVNLAKLFRGDAEGNLTEELPGLTPGQYHALVRTDIRRNIRESNTANNALASVDLMSTDVPELRLGVPVMGTLTEGKKLYYRVNVEADLDLRLRLTSSATSASNEIYVAYGRVPTATDYDFAGREPFSANQEVLVPTTKAGVYYIMLAPKNSNISAIDFTLLGEALPFSVFDITPDTGGAGGRVTTTITGAGFRDSISVYLKLSPDSLLTAEVLAQSNSVELKVRWDLRNVALGIYDVVLRNPDGNFAELIQKFAVEPLVENKVETTILAPDFIRRGSNLVYDVTVQNRSNVDAENIIITAVFPADQAVFVQTLDFSGRPVANGILQELDSLKAGLRLGGVGVITAFAKNVPAGKKLQAQFKMPRVNIATVNFPFLLHVEAIKLQDLIWREIVSFHLLRNSVLKANHDEVPDDLLMFMQSEESGRLFLQNLKDIGFLSHSQTTLPTLPLEYVPIPTPQAANKQLRESLIYGENDIIECQREVAIASIGIGSVSFLKSLYEFEKAISEFKAKPLLPYIRIVWPGIGLFIGGVLLIDSGISLYCEFQTCDGILGEINNFLNDDDALFSSFINNVLQRSIVDTIVDGLTFVGNMICKGIFQALDPNDITGPAGFGDERWITATQTLPYTIRFENDSTRATAAAQVVAITQKLDSTLDARSFRLGSFGFANLTFTVPENHAFYSERLDVRDSLGVFVDITAGIDITTNEAFWIFRAIDPPTGQLPVFNGFVPVNDAQHRGEGFANYTIRPKRDAKTGDVVHAKARIIFDTNEPIDTPEIFNTIDAVVPTSRVTALPSAFNQTTLTVSWSGADDPTGSQIRDFALYVSADDNPFELYEEGITDTSLVFSGDFGSTYRFFTIVHDNAGNSEALKAIPEASVTLDPTVAVAENKAELPKTFELYQNYPNPFNPATIIKYDLPVPSEVKLEIFDILGRRVHVLVDAKQNAGFHHALWDGKTEAGRSVVTGVYFYRLAAKGFVKTRKMLVLR